MQGQNSSRSTLTSPGFLLGLGLLLLNDFILKAAFHNWLTGKLSDFAGLFIFPLFFTAFFPRQKVWIYAATALGFVWWKSAYSQPLFVLLNSQPYYNVDRVVDVTDLIALTMLPLSFLYSRRTAQRPGKPLLIYTCCLVSVFAFAATSFASQKATYTEEYQFDLPAAKVIQRIEQLAPLHLRGGEVSDSAQKQLHFQIQQSLPIAFDITFADYGFGHARILMIPDGNTSKLSLISIETRTSKKLDDTRREELLRHFEKEFIEEVRKDPVKKSSAIQEVWFWG